MSHAQDRAIYDKFMGIIINLKLACNRHNLENGFLSFCESHSLIVVCVCVKYTIDIRKSMCWDRILCRAIVWGLSRPYALGLLSLEDWKKMFLHVDVTWTILQTDWFIMNIRTCVGRALSRWIVDRILIWTFKMRNFFVGGIKRNMQITSVLLYRCY
jgi:hypothetical protein